MTTYFENWWKKKTVKERIEKCGQNLINKETDQSLTLKERCIIIIKTLNVLRRVIKNLLARPDEDKCKSLKK